MLRICSLSLAIAGALFVAFLDWSRLLSLSTVSGVLFLLVGAVLVARVWARGRALLDNPIYLACLAYILYIGTGPLLAPLARSWPFFSESPTTLPVVLSWAGLAALAAGYGTARFAFARSAVNSASPADRELELPIIKYVGLFYTAVGLIGLILYLAVSGGLGHFLDTPYGTRGNPSVYAGGYGMLRPGLFLLVAWAASRKRLPFGWGLALAVYGVFDALWFGPLRGSRHDLITLVLILVYFAKTSPARKQRSLLRSLPAHWLLLAGLTFALIWGGVRNYSIRQLSAWGSVHVDLARDVESAAVMAVYTPYDTFSRIVDAVPESFSYRWGSSFYESATVLIPRSIWPSKPTPLGTVLQEGFYGSAQYGNATPSWPGELFLNFGLLGLLPGLFLTGAFSAWVARWNRPSDSLTVQTLLYGATYALVTDLMWGGSNAAVWYWFFNILPVYLAARFAEHCHYSAGRSASRNLVRGALPATGHIS
jgi:hypothetical protein